MLKRVIDWIADYATHIAVVMIGAACLFAACDALAACLTSDRWRGHDKALHFMGGAAIATAVTVHTRDPWTGFYAGVAAGAAKELLDGGGIGTCSLQDFAVTAAGAALGASTGRWILMRSQGRTTLAYVTEF